MRPKPVAVTYFIDEDILRLAKILGDIRLDVTYPGDPGCTQKRRFRPSCSFVARGDKDKDWIPRVADAGWLIITRDSAIQTRKSLLAAVRDSGARMVALAGKDAVRPWDQLLLLLGHWPRIETLLTEPGPFIYSITPTTMRPVDLQWPGGKG